MREDLSLSAMIAGFVFVILVTVLVLREIPPANKTHAPAFKKSDCFNRVGIKEAWEKGPDGIIERVGRESYLVLFRDQADLNGGDKVAFTLTIKLFDESHILVSCPKTWVTHRRTK